MECNDIIVSHYCIPILSQNKHTYIHIHIMPLPMYTSRREGKTPLKCRTQETEVPCTVTGCTAQRGVINNLKMGPEMKKRINTIVGLGKTLFHIGFVPTILYLGEFSKLPGQFIYYRPRPAGAPFLSSNQSSDCIY